LCNLSRVQIVTGHSGKKDGIEKEKDEKLKPKTEGKERKVVGGQKKLQTIYFELKFALNFLADFRIQIWFGG